MDISTGWEPWETTFQGEKVKMKLRRLRRGAMLKLVPFMRMDDETEELKLVASSFELQAVAKDVFPDHVKDIDNLTLNGAPPTPDDLADETVFNSLVMEIIARLCRMSMLSKSDEKNSGGLSAVQRLGESPKTPYAGSPPISGWPHSTIATSGTLTGE
ncbi:MAG: hypothetical protein ABIJ57_11540 [Pseudomonadota bacterium]